MAIETETKKSFPPGARADLARQWIDELVVERILVKGPAGPDEYQLNPDLIVGETPLQHFVQLPPDPSENRLPLGLLILYALNSFLFLILSFFFLPDSVVKIVGSAAGVILGVLGLKSLNPRESGGDPRLWLRRLTASALTLATILQVTLLAIGFSNPCRIKAIPGSTVLVDGKFLERTPDPPLKDRQGVENLDSPENLLPWLTAQRRNHFLRWETHEIKITKKWYVDNERSQESVQNVSVDLSEIWSPKKAFAKWEMKAEQKPYIRIDYGGAGSKDRDPKLADESGAGSDTAFTNAELRGFVEEWDEIWAAALADTDVVGHKRMDLYVAAVALAEDQSSPYLTFQIRDWMDKPLKALRPIVPRAPGIDVSSQSSPAPSAPDEKTYKRLLAESVRDEIFEQLRNELGFPLKIKPKASSPQIASLTQQLKIEIESPRATASPAPSPLSSPRVTPGPSPTAIVAATVAPAATPTPASTPVSTPPAEKTDTVAELTKIAKDAADKGQLDVAVSTQQQLAQMVVRRSPGPVDKLQLQVEQSQNTLKEAIKRNSGSGRIYLHIADESQRQPATEISNKLKGAGFAVIGIQNVGGRAYIPDTAEVRFFAFPDPPATKKAAEQIVAALASAGVRKPRPSYVIPSAQEKKNSIEIASHFEIWFARDSFASKAAD